MKLDYDLIREILLITEKYSDGRKYLFDKFYLSHIEDKSKGKLIRYHLKFLQDAGYIQCELTSRNVYRPIDLTPEGRAYLDSIRRNDVWEKVKQSLSDNIGDVSLSVIKAVATKIATDIILHL